jgi:hypothetical protein
MLLGGILSEKSCCEALANGQGLRGTLMPMMRAILFASATVKSLVGRRCKTPGTKPPAALFHCGARPTIDMAPRTSGLRIPALRDISIGENLGLLYR